MSHKLINRTLIIGTGSMGQRHLHYVRNLIPESEVRIMKTKSIDSTLNEDANLFIDLQNAIAYNPSITIIANPATFHLAFAQSFAEIGSHLFIEKPLSYSSERIKSFLQICTDKKLILQVGYNMRFSLSLQKFKEIVDSGKLGSLQKIECETGKYLPDWRPDSDYRLGVSARKVLGGGVLLELSHEIDYLRWIFGEVNWVSGELTTESDLEIDVEDTARFKMSFHDMSDLNELVADVTLDFVRRTPSRICRVYGSIANLEWNGLTGEVSIFEHNKNVWEKIYTDPNDLNKTYELEWLSFIDSVNTGNKPFVTGEDGLRVIEIIEAIRIASDTGGKVPVVYDLSIGKN